MIIVSACLAGVKCRYNRTHRVDSSVLSLVREGKAIPLCPEVLGGLSIPREPCEIRTTPAGRRVFTKSGRNVTEEFLRGAERTLGIAREAGASEAVLASRSPSCGSRIIYDGSFSGKLIAGVGITASLLTEHGIRVLSEDETDELSPHGAGSPVEGGGTSGAGSPVEGGGTSGAGSPAEGGGAFGAGSPAEGGGAFGAGSPDEGGGAFGAGSPDEGGGAFGAGSGA